MTLRTQESILESVETGPDQHSNSFRDIVMRDAEEADTGVVSYFFIFVQLPGDPYKSVPTHVTKNCSNVML